MISCLWYPSPSRLPLLISLCLTPGGWKPLVDWHSQFGQSTAQKPIHSHYRHGDSGIISGLPEAILQDRRESSGNQWIIKLFTSAPIPAATWKAIKEAKTWSLRWHHLIAEHSNKWLNHSLKSSFRLVLLLITFPCRTAISDCLSHLY